MTFVFVAGVSHCSYKSNIFYFMPGRSQFSPLLAEPRLPIDAERAANDQVVDAVGMEVGGVPVAVDAYDCHAGTVAWGGASRQGGGVRGCSGVRRGLGEGALGLGAGDSGGTPLPQPCLSRTVRGRQLSAGLRCAGWQWDDGRDRYERLRGVVGLVALFNRGIGIHDGDVLTARTHGDHHRRRCPGFQAVHRYCNGVVQSNSETSRIPASNVPDVGGYFDDVER